MTRLRIRHAADVLGVSDDTVRRWIAAGELTSVDDASGRATVDGRELARLAQRRAPENADDDGSGIVRSARNHFVGLVTDVRSDAVMSQVRMQCGPFEVTSLISTDAVEELGLEPGVLATAVIKATNVIIEKKDMS